MPKHPIPRPSPADFAQSAYRRWAIAFVSVVALVVGFVLGANLLLDPYQIFNITNLRDSYTPNEVYNKVERVLEDPRRFDAFFVGSSRMGMYEPAAAQAAHPQRRYYNLSVLGVEPDQQLAMLQTLVTEGVAVHEVVIGIDLYPFLTRRGHRDPAHQPHPRMSGQDPDRFLAGYLFLASYKNGFSRLMHTLRAEADIGFDFQVTGRYHLYGYERERAADPAGYAAKRFPQSAVVVRPQGPPTWVEPAFADLAKIRDWADANQVRVYWFIHPLHPSVLANVPDGTVAEFRERVFSILGPIADFSEDPAYLDSNDYYDAKHYTPEVASRILAEVFQDRRVARP